MTPLHSRLLCVCGLLLSPITCRAAIDIQFNYTYDTGNFFSGANIGRRSLLDAAANVFESRLTLETFGAIVPGGGNTWSLSFPNPTTGVNVTLNNPTVPANTITIYAGARDLPGSQLGQSDYQYTYFGNGSWVSLFQSRDSTTNFDSFGGAITFDSLAPYYFDADPLTLENFPGQYDFFSVAQHEIEHLLGFTDGANAFSADISGTTFTGTVASTLNGGPAPLASGSDRDHWQQGLMSEGREVLMDPTFFFNQRKTATPLDFAALRDIGYRLNPVGDYNLNGSVDAADYTLWRNTLGQIGPVLAADGDGDNQIDLDDFFTWRNHYGETVLAASGATLFSSSSVPEPAAAQVFLAVMMAILYSDAQFQRRWLGPRRRVMRIQPLHRSGQDVLSERGEGDQ
jgi:hypothetical protein